MSEMDNANITQGDTLEETDRKCPQCSGTMDFDPETGGLACPFCGYTEEIPNGNDLAPETAQELDFDSAEKKENCNWGVQKKTINCKSCGAQTIYDALDVANECPYCGSNQVMEAKDENTIAPGGVVPFKITSENASENFKKWIGKKFFCPKLAKQSARPDSFKGIYLPYWTFDADTTSSYTGEYGIDKKVKQGDQEKIVTNWHHTSGKYKQFFDDELVIGTNRHNTAMLKCIEPFNTADNKAYKPEYVAGFVAERYSIGLKDAWETAKKAISGKIHSRVSTKIRNEHHADHVRNVHIRTVYSNLTYKYLMLPIWCSSYKYKDKIYQFVVNGQTGKVYGKTPISVGKVLLVVGIVLLVLFGFALLVNCHDILFNISGNIQ